MYDQSAIVKTKKPIPKKTYTPFGCLVALHIFEEELAGGLVAVNKNGVATPSSKSALRALVIATGPECKQIKEGDVVLIIQAITVFPCLHEGHLTNLCREDHISGIEQKGKCSAKTGGSEQAPAKAIINGD